MRRSICGRRGIRIGRGAKGCRLSKAPILKSSRFLCLFILGIVSCLFLRAPSAGAASWYVNDSSVIGDSFTAAAGNDVGPGSAGGPYRTIIKALTSAVAGDTIYVDKGIFDSFVVFTTAGVTETAGVKIDTDNIAIIGVDSASTIIDPLGSTSEANFYAIHADTQTGLVIKNIGATAAAKYGVHWINVDLSTVTGCNFNSNGAVGMYLENSDTNTVSNNSLNSNVNYGIYLNSSQSDTISNNSVVSSSTTGMYIVASTNNTLSGNTAGSTTGDGIQISGGSFNILDNNTCTTNTSDGIEIQSSSNNIVKRNILLQNSAEGLLLLSSSKNVILNNVIRSNSAAGIDFSSSDSNIVMQNDISANDTGVWFEPTATNNLVTKNNITANNVNNIRNQGGLVQTVTRNWWGTADEVAIKAKLSDTASAFSPYRLGAVDTAAGADTTAPAAVTGVTLDTSGGVQIKLTWVIPTLNEETSGGAVGFVGLNIWRLKEIPDTTNWSNSVNLVKQTTSTDTTWTDTAVLAGLTYYYRLTSKDTGTYFNESFFTDTKFAKASLAANTSGKWFVNDTYNFVSDSFTYAGGSDTAGNGTRTDPYRTITKALGQVKAGDTIYIDGGTYLETVTIDTTQLTLIGKDSASAIIEGGDTVATNNYVINLTANANYTVIRNLRIYKGYTGIQFNAADSCTIDRVTCTVAGTYGMYFTSGANDNLVESCVIQDGTSDGLVIQTGSRNTIRGCHVARNARYGIYLLNSSSASNKITGNTVEDHNGLNDFGIFLDNLTTDNTVENNVSRRNSRNIYLNNATNTVIRSNVISDATGPGGMYGLMFLSGSNNAVSSNLFKNNGDFGLYLSGASGVMAYQNTFDSNAKYAIYIDGGSSSDTFIKNNIFTSSSNPDSGFYNASTTGTATFSAVRNWWDTTDEVRIKTKIYQRWNSDSVSFTPYRLGPIDTAAGADTTAPGLVTGLTLDTSGGVQVKLTWVIPTLNEETNGGTVGFNGLNIWRLKDVADTTNWANPVNLAKQTTSTDTTWTDTAVLAGLTYYYRLTSKDAAAIFNESFFTDTKFSKVTLSANTGGNWFVNDTYVSFSDSFTYAGGSDTAGNGTRTDPYRTITKALAQVKAGDTIYIDAGAYMETVVIETNSISLIGKDSNATVIDPPGANSTSGLYGIYADTQTNLLIKNLGVTGAYDGIQFYNVDLSTLTGDSACSNGDVGIYLLAGSDSNTLSAGNASLNTLHGIRIDTGTNNTLTANAVNSNFNFALYLLGGSTNTVSNNTVNSNSNYGIYLSSSSNNTLSGNTATSNVSSGIVLFNSSNNNTVTNNTSNSNTNYGISINSGTNNTVSNNTTNSNTGPSGSGIVLDAASSNVVTGNTANSNAFWGIWLDVTANNNTIKNNLARQNASAGIRVNSADTNLFVQNDVSGNDTGAHILGSSSGNRFSKNNFTGNNVNNVYNQGGIAQTLTRNWFGATDEVTIKAKFTDTASAFSPYRLGTVDTTAGADTTAPGLVTGLTLDTTGGLQIKLTWVIPTINEETNGGAVGFNGLNIWRLKEVPDTTNWANSVNLVKQTVSTDTTWTDTAVFAGFTYYYRLTSKDTGTYFNESFFTDTKFAKASLAANVSGVWFVNDTYVFFSDSFTYSGGSDTAGNGTRTDPYRTITKALAQVKAGDTIYIDAGAYMETVVIETNSISLIGKDSNAAVIDPPGANTTAGLYGIYATNRTNLLIKTLGVTGAYNGIRLSNVDLSTVTGDSACSTGQYGIYVLNGSETNTVSFNAAHSNNIFGSGSGIYIEGSSGNTVSNNRADSNVYGIYLFQSSGDTLSSNEADSNSSYGFYLAQSSNNTLSANTAISNYADGIDLQISSNNTLSNNTARSNTGSGVTISSSYNNLLSRNTSQSNQYGFYLQSASSNTLLNNTAASNTNHGFYLTTCTNTVFVQNMLDANTNYQVYLTGTTHSDTFLKNNFKTSGTNPDSGVYNSTTDTFDFTRNWWYTTDEVSIDRLAAGTASPKKITFRPYRLGQVDTAAGADTTAPAAVTGVTLDTSVGLQIKLTWVIPTLNEETNGGAVGFVGLNIWRLKETPDTTNWANTVNLVKQTASTDTTWTDTAVLAGLTYYYRLTSKDTGTYFNESFFTDTKFAKASLAANVSGVWFVNDTYVFFSDSFTYAGGSDTAGNGTRTDPYRTITKALGQVKAGDTIYIDAGIYAETIVIDTDQISLIGKDSNATVVDPPGVNSTTGLYGIYADTQTRLLIKTLGVTGANYGIKFVNADLSTITGDSVCYNGADGILLFNGSDTNTLRNNYCYANQSGIDIASGSINNTVDTNACNSNSQNGILLDGASNTITNNTTESNTVSGIQVGFNVNNNTIKSNTTRSNLQYGIYFNNSQGNFVYNNSITSNAHAGVYLSGSNNSVVSQNYISANDTGVLIVTTATGNILTKNVITGNNVKDVYNSGGIAQTLTRNWFGSTDEVAIKAKFSDTASAFSPYRLGAVDTAAGADTTAPGFVTGLTLDTTGGLQIRLTWAVPTLNEETNGGAVGFVGLNIWRLKDTPDTTNWANTVNLVKQTTSTDTTWTDTAVAAGSVYYYRLTSKDTGTYFNESFFTDTKYARASLAANTSGIWYVNDTYVFFSDSFTYTSGSDTAGNGTRNDPYRTIGRALRSARAGETLYIDGGLYSETVVVDTDQISLIGKDSNATVIDPPGTDTGISAFGRARLLIKNLGVIGADRAIYFSNVDLSTLSGDSVSNTTVSGMYLENGCDSLTVEKNLFVRNSTGGGSVYAFFLSGHDNTVRQNSFVENVGTNMIITSPATNNLIQDNTVRGGTYGIWLNQTGANSNRVIGNTITDVSQIGIPLDTTDSNLVLRNTVRGAALRGINLFSSNSNVIEQNTIDSNAGYQIYVDGSSNTDAIRKNNITTSPQFPDSGVFNNTVKSFDFSRNWWGMTDESRIRAKVAGAGADSIAFRPYRLGVVDTAAGADTTAPAAPTGLTLDSSVVSQMKVTWVNPAANEEVNGGAVGFTGIRVYRTKNLPDTTNWANALVWTAGSTDTTWIDTTVAGGATYYYRLTSRDAASFVNESFFTDTKFDTVVGPSLSLNMPNGGEAWLVGETRTIGWTTVGTIPTVKLEYSTDSGANFFNIITTSTSNTGSYAWNIPNTIGSGVRVKVTSTTDFSLNDSSNANFSIRGALTLTRPNGGDSFLSGLPETVTWTSTGTINAVRLEYSLDSGATWSNIIGSTFNGVNGGSYIWSVPNADDTRVKVRVSSDIDTATADTTDTTFRIWPRAVPPPPGSIKIDSGNHQLGRVSTACTIPLRVQVVDTGGSAGVQYARVTFTVRPEFPESAHGGYMETAMAVYTDASGFASNKLFLGYKAGVYRVEATTDSTTPSKTVVFTAYADGRQVPAGGSTAGVGWRMVGPNKSVSGWNLRSQIASGGLGSAAKVYEWRAELGNSSVGSGNTMYYDPGTTADAVRGRAYWVKEDLSGGRVFVPTEGTGSQVDTVSIRLPVAGWYQIASGQYFYVSWDSSVRFDTSSVTDTPLAVNQRMTPAQAADTSLGVIQNKVYWYTGSNYVYGPAGETPSLVTLQLKPMVGFWLRTYKACTMYIYPNPASPDTNASEILNQAPAYTEDGGQPATGNSNLLSAYYQETNKSGSEADWAIQLIASSGVVTDWQNYVGVKPTAAQRQQSSAMEAPGLAAEYLTLAVKPAKNGAAAGEAHTSSDDWMAASYGDPTTTGRAWDVVLATDLNGAATLRWDNVSNLPTLFEAFLIGGPNGPVDLRKSSVMVLPQIAGTTNRAANLVLAVGLSEFVAPFLAAPLSKEQSFVYPNPGPDATGNMTFKYNLQGSADVSLKIYDVGGKLVKEQKATGIAGSNTMTWDTTNKNGQKLGSGVYIYIMESGGNKLVDKLAIVR